MKIIPNGIITDEQSNITSYTNERYRRLDAYNDGREDKSPVGNKNPYSVGIKTKDV